jgi:hypothetical protein
MLSMSSGGGEIPQTSVYPLDDLFLCNSAVCLWHRLQGHVLVQFRILDEADARNDLVLREEACKLQKAIDKEPPFSV